MSGDNDGVRPWPQGMPLAPEAWVRAGANLGKI